MRPKTGQGHDGGQAPAGARHLRVAACRGEPGEISRANTMLRWHTSIGRVLAYMRAHLDERQSTEALADIAALSRFHFNRVFRLVTGLPPAFFLTALRIETAKLLLLTTNRSVTDVCMDVGYTSLGTFVSRFTDLVGLSPRAFRRAAGFLDGMDLSALLAGQDGVAGPASASVDVQARIVATQDAVICAALYDVRLPGAHPLRCAMLVGSGHAYFDRLPAGTYVVLAGAIRPVVDPDAFLDRGVFLRAASPAFTVGTAMAHRFELVLRPPLPFDPPVLAPLPGMLAVRLMEGSSEASILAAAQALSGGHDHWVPPSLAPRRRRFAIG